MANGRLSKVQGSSGLSGPLPVVALDDADELEEESGGRDHMLTAKHQRELVVRLNRVEGQVRGIRRMVEEPRLCVEILQQLAASSAALNRVAHSILKYHVEKCVPEGIEAGGNEQRKRLTELVDIFDRFSR